MFISAQHHSSFSLHICYSCSFIHLHTGSDKYLALYLCGLRVKACNNGRQLQRLVPYLNQSWHNLTQTVGLTFLPLAALSRVHFGKQDTYLLTYSMVLSPSWEANWFAASQEIPRISRNPKVHYRTHKRPPPISILGPPNPVHIPTSYLLEFHPSTPRPPQWSLSLRFPHQNPTHSPVLTHTRHMPSPSHSSRFYHPHNIGWEVQII